MKAKAVSGETPKRELTRILAAYERGEIDVLVNAQLLAEGWNSPRATVCMHLAPTASKRIYQQRVGRVTRRTPGKEAGIVVDFVHPATPNDDPVVTLHSLLDRDVYRGGAIVVGPVRRGRGRRLRVERRVVPVTADPERRAQVFERELWRIAVEHLSWGEQQAWAMLAGARVASNNWRRAKAMLHFDSTGELRRLFLVTCLRRNRNTQLRVRALGEVGSLRDPEAFDDAVEIVGGWSRDERREGVKVLLQALTEKQIGRRDQAARWLWHLAEYSREVHEEYAVQRWPETKRLLGPAGELRGRGARAQRAAAGAGGAQAGPAPVGRAAGGRAGAHARGAAGAGRGAHAHGPQAERAGARAAEELPQGQAPPRRPPQAQEGRRDARRRGARTSTRRRRDEPETPDERPDDGRRPRPTTAATTRTPPARSRTQPGEPHDERDAAGLARQVHFARVERDAPVGGVDDQRAARVHPGRGALLAAVRPAHRAAEQRVAGAPRGQDLIRRAHKPARRARPRPRASGVVNAWPRPPPARSEVACSSAGNSSVATFSPIPSTAQPSWGRPSTRMPATLRPSIQTSFGHLIAASSGSASQTATAAASGSVSLDARAAPPTSAPPTAAARSRRGPGARGRRVCSSAVTSVPCGAPARGQRAGALVGRVGDPEVDPGATDHRGRRRTSASGRRASVPAASPRLIATASVR